MGTNSIEQIARTIEVPITGFERTPSWPQNPKNNPLVVPGPRN
jgi:hypothetical protein